MKDITAMKPPSLAKLLALRADSLRMATGTKSLTRQMRRSRTYTAPPPPPDDRNRVAHPPFSRPPTNQGQEGW